MISDRLIDLMPEIQRKAAFVASMSMTADDIAQEMALSILERADKNSGLSDQKDAYILNAAYLHGGLNSARHERLCHERHTSDVIVASDNADDDEPEFGELVPATTTTPEETYIQFENISDTLMQLAPANRRVLAMLYLGYSETEIARDLHISRPAVTQRKKVIAKVLAAVML